MVPERSAVVESTSASKPLRILCNGYPVRGAGSIAGAMYRLLEQFLSAGHHVEFVGKRSFVYPQDLLETYDHFRFTDATNHISDAAYERIGRRFGLTGHATLGQFNHHLYQRGVMRVMRERHAQKRFDLALFLGVAAFARVPGLPAVSWIQGAPGSDVRSLMRHRELMQSTHTKLSRWGMQAYARYRMSLGLPNFSASDVIIVGSEVSRRVLREQFLVPSDRVHRLPYPLDLSKLKTRCATGPTSGPLNVLWLGRIVPRKRLDLFLDGIAQAIQSGVDVHAQVVGRIGFAKGLQILIDRFPYPERLSWTPQVPHDQVGTLLGATDLLIQPSEEEDFGSSVAEAMACGTPAIVGPTNGMREYLCPKGMVMTDDRPVTLGGMLIEAADRKAEGTLHDPAMTRATAERWFDPERVTDAFLARCNEAMAERFKSVSRREAAVAS